MKTLKNQKILFALAMMLSLTLWACEESDPIEEIVEEENTETNDTVPDISGYPIVETNQTTFYNSDNEINLPGSSDNFYGQDANYTGNEVHYIDNGNGTITDMVTGLMWQKSADTDGDGDIDANDKLSFSEAVARASELKLGGYDDWRLPTIKELYSLIIFSGVDPSGYEGSSTDGLVPFIDTDYFDFAYGDMNAGERIIDAQYATATRYVDYTMMGDETMFGVNFADGRIKGYGLSLHGQDKEFFTIYVRGNETYGINNFVDNGDGTITDIATGLMWMQDDSGEGMNWQDALNYAENLDFAGYDDWKLPDVKELQSILDYTKSPETNNSAAIDSKFNCSEITNEGGQKDYPFYWSGTTHANWSNVSGANAAYVSFGRALGFMGEWLDVHGAGAQRSDPKKGDAADYPTGHGPQGDAIRINNYVRAVRLVK